MSSLKMYSLTNEDISGLLNQGREMIAESLERSEMLDEEQLKELRENTAFIVVEKGVLGSIIDKIKGIGDKPIIQIVKL